MGEGDEREGGGGGVVVGSKEGEDSNGWSSFEASAPSGSVVFECVLCFDKGESVVDVCRGRRSCSVLFCFEGKGASSKEGLRECQTHRICF